MTPLARSRSRRCSSTPGRPARAPGRPARAPGRPARGPGRGRGREPLARLGLALGCALAVGLAFALAGCCALGPEDLALIRTMQATSLGDARDERLPPEARAIGQDHYDAWSQLRRAAEGTPLPLEVRARVEARRAAPASSSAPLDSGATGTTAMDSGAATGGGQ
ncbi:MAG: hypothetical protein AB7O37_23250 [Vicinamibacteria bacterium]